MKSGCPGLNPQRLVRLMQAAIQRCELDLQGAVVLTEAATGAYVVTPVLAATAGAHQVFAVTRSSRYGSVEQVSEQTHQLAELAGVRERIEIVTQKTREIVAQADIITNTGHVRPIDAKMVGWMKPTAVIPLMYEAWELRPDDLDLAACRRRGLRLAGTNECHPAVGVFPYLGVMAVRLLQDAGIAVFGCRVMVLCDNTFAEHIMAGLAGAGAAVTVLPRLPASLDDQPVDAILVALQPGQQPLLGRTEVQAIRRQWSGAVVAQLWGDVDRAALAEAGVPCWPPEAPSPSHMGILPSAVGPEPVVRLQAGGLKVAELLLCSSSAADAEFAELAQPL